MLKQALRQHLQQTFSEQDLKRWYDPLDLSEGESDRHLNIFFPHAFFSSWFADNMQGRFEEQLNAFLGPGYAIRYVNGNGNGSRGTPLSVHRPKTIDYPFGNQFTFESFLVNKKNYFPLASAKEVAKQSQTIFNPFVVCGEHGSGKTHLLKALGNELSKRLDTRALFFGTPEDIYSVYQNHYRGDVFKARQHFQEFEALLVDDFQLIRHHPSLQPELVILFNHFYDQKRQMVFACSEKLTSYDFLESTLKSRLEWGLIVNLKTPDLEIRVEFIKEHCRKKSIHLSKDQVLTLAQRFRDFRYLQGILLKLLAFRELVNKEIGARDFEHILSHTEDKPKPGLTPDAVIDRVAAHFEIDVKEIKGSRRHKHVVKARQVAMYLCRELLGSSYPSLGAVFGGKDHSTALYAVNKIDTIQRDDKDMKQLLTTLKEKCLSLDE